MTLDTLATALDPQVHPILPDAKALAVRNVAPMRAAATTSASSRTPGSHGPRFTKRASAPLSRNELLALLAVVAFANGVSERAVAAIAQWGITAALLNSFDVSLIVWGAFMIGISFVRRSPQQPITRSDTIISGAALAAVLAPGAQLSWIALSGLAVHILRTSPRPSFVHRGGWILLATTVPMLWSRLLFGLFSGPILEADAALVGWLAGAARVGNTVQLADGSGYVWIAPGCSSLANVSLTVLCWVTFAKVLDRVGSLRDMGWCCLACAAVIAVNVTRISLIALYPGSYDLIHGPIGYTIVDWTSVGVIVGTCLLRFRRAL